MVLLLHEYGVCTILQYFRSEEIVPSEARLFSSLYCVKIRVRWWCSILECRNRWVVKGTNGAPRCAEVSKGMKVLASYIRRQDQVEDRAVVHSPIA